MYKGYKPFKGNGVNTENTDPIKKNAQPEPKVNTSAHMYTGERGGRLSPAYEKDRKKRLLASNLELAKTRFDSGQLNESQYGQRVDTLNTKYKTFD